MNSYMGLSVVVPFACHPEKAFFAQRRLALSEVEGIWASRAKGRVLFRPMNRTFGSLPYKTDRLPELSPAIFKMAQGIQSESRSHGRSIESIELKRAN